MENFFVKVVNIFALVALAVVNSSCGQKQIRPHQDNINYAIKDTVTFFGPDRMIRNVKQSKDSTILLAASYGGVLRYNGKTFTNITSKIGSRRYWNVLEDRQRNLWFTTTDSGVYRYNGKTFEHFTTREGLVSNAVLAIYEDSRGRVWLGTGGGISRYDGESFRNFTTKDGLSNNKIQTIYEDRTGKLWFGTSGDACCYDGKIFTVLRNPDGKAFHNVWSIIEDKRGNIWFGASVIDDRKGNIQKVSNGLWRYDGSTFKKVSNRSASAIIEDKQGNIWTTGAFHPSGVGAWKLLRYDQKTLYRDKPIVTEIFSVNKMLCGILESKDGNIWFGSINGVYRYDGKNINDFKNHKDQR